MDYAKQQEIARLTLKQPTAGNLSETEASNRMQNLKDRDMIHGAGGRTNYVAGPAGKEFTKDWQNMMAREREWN